MAKKGKGKREKEKGDRILGEARALEVSHCEEEPKLRRGNPKKVDN